MAWTTPQTWVTGQLVTAADMNTDIRDNMLALKAPPSDLDNLVASGADVTTTSTSFVDITGLSITFTTTGGDVLLGFLGEVDVTANEVYFDFTVDTTRQGGTDGLVREIATATHSICLTHKITGLSAGAHTFTVQWKVRTATATLYTHNTSNRALKAHFWGAEIS